MERYGTVAILGVGLIGGSVGLALRARSLAERVVGVGRNEARLEEAERSGAIDFGTTSLERGLVEAEVAIVCTPVSRIAADVAQAAAVCPAEGLITDAGSTKAQIVAAIERDERARSKFVGGHPLAGSERKGVEHAQADLFDGRVCVLTPTSHTPADRLERARAFWDALGCRVVEMKPDEHDEALALTSHLPHALAAALAATVPAKWLQLAAGAYRDGTRVAGSDAALWASIFCQNRQPTLSAIEAFEQHLAALRAALAANDEAAIRELWNAARARRRLFDAQSPERVTEPVDDRR